MADSSEVDRMIEEIMNLMQSTDDEEIRDCLDDCCTDLSSLVLDEDDEEDEYGEVWE